jgi:hypothetical protein
MVVENKRVELVGEVVMVERRALRREEVRVEEEQRSGALAAMVLLLLLLRLMFLELCRSKFRAARDDMVLGEKSGRARSRWRW